MTIYTRARNGGPANRRGAMLVFVAISMVGLLGMLAVTLDVGAGHRQRRIAQTAADAGAVGGGTQIYRERDSATIVAAAFASADLNGFTSAQVTVNYPPATGTFAGNNSYVEVLINKTIPSIFGSVFGVNSLAVQARGVAGVSSTSNGCVYGLAGTGTAINIPGDLEATGCDVYSNSAIDVGKLWAANIAAVGTVDGVRAGNVSTGVPPVPDPMGSIPIPADAPCDFNNFVVTSSVTINPGVYCGGIDLGKNNVTNMNPGVYFIRGGGIDGAENGSELRGANVVIINSNGPGNNVAAFRPITFGNTCYVGLTAPTSGPYKGIVVYVDPAGPSSGPNSINEFCGKGEKEPLPDIEGIIYMPTQTFKLVNSNGKLIIAGALIANVITGQNGGGKYTIKNDNSGNSVLKRLSLVE